jgi:hypothetical protein
MTDMTVSVCVCVCRLAISAAIGESLCEMALFLACQSGLSAMYCPRSRKQLLSDQDAFFLILNSGKLFTETGVSVSDLCLCSIYFCSDESTVVLQV